MNKNFLLNNTYISIVIKKVLLFTLLITWSNLLNAQTCECKDYIYLNDTSGDEVHKFLVNSDGTLTEIFNPGGGPWYN